MSVGLKQADCGATTGKLETLVLLVGCPIRSCSENEIRGSYRDLDTPGGLAGLVLPFTSGLSTGIPYRKHRVIMV